MGVSQGYVSLLERNRRRVPTRLATKLASVLDLPPTHLPVHVAKPWQTDRVARALGALGYPGFSYLRRRRQVNPSEVLVGTLLSDKVEPRLVEALPWLVVKYPDVAWDWVVSQAKLHDVQNRLGFVVVVAKRLAERRGDSRTARTLANVEHVLETSRLQKEDTFSASTEAEKRWLQTHRSPEARQWNLLTSLSAEGVRYAV